MSTMNQGIAWNDKFKLGNEQVDMQHKKLFELVNGIVTACIEGSDTETLNETLDFLVKYTVNHFHFEEELQLEYDYPGYGNHKQLHEDFKVTVGELVGRFNENGSSMQLSNEVNKIVVRWLVNHILVEDKKIGEHMRKKEMGGFRAN